jgi:hypothetical protein
MAKLTDKELIKVFKMNLRYSQAKGKKQDRILEKLLEFEAALLTKTGKPNNSVENMKLQAIGMAAIDAECFLQ